MSIIYLIVYILIFSYIVSALIGVTMFVVDIIRFGKPHAKFERISSIEAYNQKLDEIESKEPEQTEMPVSSVDIDL